MEIVVIDAEMVSQFVHDGDHDLVGEHREVVAHIAERQPKKSDAIGQFEAAVVLSLGPRDAFVQPEQILFGVFVIDHENNVVEQVDEPVRQRVDGIGHKILEGVHVDRLHRFSVPYPVRCLGRGWERLRDVE